MTTNNLSNCCQAPLTVSTAREGTSCYICTKCHKACDTEQGKVEMNAAERAKNIYNWTCQRCHTHMQFDSYESGLCVHCHKERLKIEYDKDH